jgi:hypothetical protein
MLTKNSNKYCNTSQTKNRFLMNQVIFHFMAIFSISYLVAQTPYEKAMQSGIQMLDSDRPAAVHLFERIAKVEEDNWLPYYYAAYGHINSSWGQHDKETTLRHMRAAQEHIDDARAYGGNEAELGVLQGLLNTTYINMDARVYGPKLSPKTTDLYISLMKKYPNNPRVVLNYADWMIGSATYFKKPIEEYCGVVEKAIKLLESEQKEALQPSWGINRALSLRKQCMN